MSRHCVGRPLVVCGMRRSKGPSTWPAGTVRGIPPLEAALQQVMKQYQAFQEANASARESRDVETPIAAPTP
jgi:hypothetical protein